MRVVHCKRESYDVYIGRPSLWGNIYSHKTDSSAKYHCLTREIAIERYERDLRDALTADREFVIEKYLRPIAGKVLGCWCAPKACHGEVLIKICREVGLIE